MSATACSRVPNQSRSSASVSRAIILLRADRMGSRVAQSVRAKPPEQYERRGSLRICRCEENAHRRTLPDREDCGSRQPGRVHHRTQIVHPRLKVWRSRDAIGHPHSAFVEYDDPGEARELTQERSLARHVPNQRHVRNAAGHVNNVNVSATGDLVCDVEFAAAGVVSFRCPIAGVSSTESATASIARNEPGMGVFRLLRASVRPERAG